jgi:hypothetical protein
MCPDSEAPAVAPAAEPSDRRGESRDRRTSPSAGRRGADRPSLWQRWLGVAGRDLAIVGASLAAIVVAVKATHPIFANQPTVVQSLAKAVPATKAVLAPTPADTTQLGRLVASPQFQKDKEAFKADLIKTGHVDSVRADSIAFYAVRESYRNGIPPAVVFGVMLTENSRFVSGAMSNVGAVGLMQVYPKVWLKALSGKFGKDLATDSTNIKYGVYILSQYVKSDSGAVSAKNVSSGLLHYNGCVKGSNTPNCHTYPSKVKGYVEKLGSSICGDKGFYDCIAKPFIAGLFGKPETSQQSAAVQ